MSTKAPARRQKKSRAELLTEISKLPASAFVDTEHAAAYLDAGSPGVLQNWRSQRRGPRYHGCNDFVRYRISDLDLWMSSRAGEVRTNGCAAYAADRGA